VSRVFAESDLRHLECRGKGRSESGGAKTLGGTLTSRKATPRVVDKRSYVLYCSGTMGNRKFGGVRPDYQMRDGRAVNKG